MTLKSLIQNENCLCIGESENGLRQTVLLKGECVGVPHHGRARVRASNHCGNMIAVVAKA